MARRVGWKTSVGGRKPLSQATRDRYTRAAESGALTGTPVPANQARAVAYRYWSSGGDLRAARGHAPKPTTPEPVRQAAASSVAGTAGDLEAATLRVWRETLAPSWIPPSRSFLADDAAAALAELPNPKGWADVHFTPHADGTWSMTVERQGGGYPAEITLPDRTAAQAVMAVLSGLGPDEDWEGWDDFGDWWDEHDFDVADTDGAT